MKNLFFPLLALAFSTGLYSCSEDFEVAAPYKEITLVYGFMDIRDTAHYIRIQKAFLDENKSAIEMSREADSNFFNDLTVRMKELAGTAVVSDVVLDRKDLAAEGYPKDSGAFFNSPNYAYKYKNGLNPNHNYRLVIMHGSSGLADSSEITVLDTNQIKVFKPFTTINYQFNFQKTVPKDVPVSTFTVEVKPGPAIRYLESVIRFHWVDRDLNSGVETDKSADFVFASKPAQEVLNGVLSVPNLSIYSFLNGAMKTAPAGVERYIDSTDIFIYVGGADFYNYILVNQVQSGGLTGDQIKPIYTNIQGKDVYGLFSSRTYVAKLGIPIDPITLDSLKQNPLTQPLNIKGVADH